MNKYRFRIAQNKIFADLLVEKSETMSQFFKLIKYVYSIYPLWYFS